ESLRFLFHATATPAPHALSLHDALPIWQIRESNDPLEGHDADFAQQRPALPPTGIRPTQGPPGPGRGQPRTTRRHRGLLRRQPQDRKSTRLNSSHVKISYAIFCLKKKTE